MPAVQMGIKFTMFFDRRAVIDAVARANRRSLSKAGGWLRLAARRSIRSRKSISKPGSPPSSHTRVLKDGILYGYDAVREDVVVGAVIRRGADRDRLRGPRAPELLEKGGTVTRLIRRGGRKRRLRMTYRARPYMAPTLAKARQSDALAPIWKNSVRG